MGGRGKSSNSLVEAISMATARPLLGETPTERCRVWYHCGDDNMEELLRRVAAICQHYNIDMAELEGWLFLTTPREFELRVAEGFMDVKTDEGSINRIHDQIEVNEIDVSILDPLVKLHSVNESGTGMDRVLGVFQAIADEHGCSIEIVHHTRKNGAGHSDTMQGEDDMRGSSSIHGAVRSQRLVNVMPIAEAAKLQIPESERRRYIRISTEKPNYAPSGKGAWYKLASATIANGDNVGVVEPWQHPGETGITTPEMEAADRKAESVFLLLLKAHQGPASSSKNSQHYAPKLFAKHPTAKVSKAALELALERFLADGRVVIGSEKMSYGGAREKLNVADNEG
jgi:RecA-family ATPase